MDAKSTEEIEQKLDEIADALCDYRQQVEKLEREYPEVWSDFGLELVDKSLVIMFKSL